MRHARHVQLTREARHALLVGRMARPTLRRACGHLRASRCLPSLLLPLPEPESQSKQDHNHNCNRSYHPASTTAAATAAITTAAATAAVATAAVATTGAASGHWEAG